MHIQYKLYYVYVIPIWIVLTIMCINRYVMWWVIIGVACYVIFYAINLLAYLLHVLLLTYYSRFVYLVHYVTIIYPPPCLWHEVECLVPPAILDHQPRATSLEPASPRASILSSWAISVASCQWLLRDPTVHYRALLGPAGTTRMTFSPFFFDVFLECPLDVKKSQKVRKSAPKRS